MSQTIQQAVGQVRLTNVAVVRLKVKKKRFEVACYKNKVINWRNGQERDLDEVLQIENVFQNVGKGQVARKKDLVEAFGTDERDAIIRRILDKGELQVSEKEREAVNESKFKEIASAVASRCVNPATMRPYPVSTIESAMRDTIHYAVVRNKSVKQQSLNVIRQLEKVMPIKRAQMLVKLAVPVHRFKALEAKCGEWKSRIVQSGQEATDANAVAQVLIDPGVFRQLSDAVASWGGTVEVKDFSVSKTKEADVEEELAAMSQSTESPGTGALEEVEGRREARAPRPADAEEKPRVPASERDEEGGDLGASLTLEERRKLMRKCKKKDRKKQRKAQSAQGAAEDGADAVAPRKDHHNAAQRFREEGPFGAVSAEDASPGTLKGEMDKSDLRCSTCGCSFGQDRTLLKEHYRSDLHRVNLKLKMKELPCISLAEYGLLSQGEIDGILHDYR